MFRAHKRAAMEICMNRCIRVRIVVAVAAAILTSAIAVAQQPPQAKAPAAPKQTEQGDDPQACAHERATVGEGGGINVKKQPDQTLSEKLAQSNGVICPPPHVDPEIKAPTPEGGTMPVIPPPGSPGGNPRVQPK
jgi:hypothetical protein